MESKRSSDELIDSTGKDLKDPEQVFDSLMESENTKTRSSSERLDRNGNPITTVIGTYSLATLN